MTKEQIIEYVMHTPMNTNPAVLKSMLDSVSGSDLPPIEEGDAGKVLTVNDGETGAEWAAVSGGQNWYEPYITIQPVSNVPTWKEQGHSEYKARVLLGTFDADDQDLLISCFSNDMIVSIDNAVVATLKPGRIFSMPVEYPDGYDNTYYVYLDTDNDGVHLNLYLYIEDTADNFPAHSTETVTTTIEYLIKPTDLFAAMVNALLSQG